MKQSRKKIIQYSRKDNNKSSNFFFLLPVILIISVLPFIMRYHGYDTGLSSFPWFSSNGMNQDIFLYYKQIFFIVISVLMVFIIAPYSYRHRKNIKLPYLFVFLGIYGLFAFLSTIISEYRNFGFTGMFDHFESIFVLLGYCIVPFYIFVFVKTEEDIRKIFKWLLISLTVMNIIGLSQSAGRDIITSKLGQQIILPAEILKNLENFSIGFGKGTVFLTLFNPNYAGVYVGMLLPVIFTILVLYSRKMSKVEVALYIVNILGLIMCLYKSGSTAALIGIIAIIPFFVILLWDYLFKKKYVGIGIVAGVLVVLSAIVVYKFDTIKAKYIPLKSEATLNEINTTEQIEIKYKNNELYIDYDINDYGNMTISIMDENKSPIGYTMDIETGYFVIQDERFQNIKFISTGFGDELGIKINIENSDWEFLKRNGEFYYLNRFMRLDKIKTAESAIFTGYENIASGRGYIWSRTIPLLKEYVLLGSGADTFVVAFPQQDYVNLYNYGMSTALLTKPHNLYLQMGVQTGIISLLSFLIFYLIYFADSIKLYFRCGYKNSLEVYGVAIFIGSISYMIMGLSNDSSIAVAPVYWTLIGIGISVNYRIKNSISSH